MWGAQKYGSRVPIEDRIMNNVIKPIFAATASLFVIVAANTVAQGAPESSIEPMQPSATEPMQPSVTEPMQPSMTEPRAPATTEPMDPEVGSRVPPVQGIPNSVAETQPGQERTAPIERHADHMDTTPAQRVELFEAADADGDLRLQRQELQEQGMNMEQDAFEELDADESGDLDRGEFVGVGSNSYD